MSGYYVMTWVGVGLFVTVGFVLGAIIGLIHDYDDDGATFGDVPVEAPDSERLLPLIIAREKVTV
jgi:hypothetical protein